VRGLDPLSSEPAGDAPDFLDVILLAHTAGT